MAAILKLTINGEGMFDKAPEILILLLIILLLFGAKKLPELARGIGQAGRELRKGFSGEEDETPSKKDNKK